MKLKVFISITKVGNKPLDSKEIFDLDLPDKMVARYAACRMFLERHPEVVLKPLDLYKGKKAGLWEGIVSIKSFKDHRVKWPVVSRVEEEVK